MCIVFHPNNVYIVSGDIDGTVYMWNSMNGEIVAKFTGAHSSIYGLAFSPDVTRLAAGVYDAKVLVWNVSPLAAYVHVLPVRTLDSRADTVFRVAFNHENYIVYQSDQRLLRIVGTATMLDSIINVIERDTDISEIAVSPFEADIYAWSNGSSLTVYNARVRHYMAVRRFDHHILALAFAPNRSGIVVATRGNDLYIWNFEVFQNSLIISSGHRGSIRGVAYSSNGEFIVSGSDDDTVRVWDARTGMHKLTYDEHGAGINAVSVSRDNTRVASASDDGTVHVWNATTGVQESEFLDPDAPDDAISAVLAVAFHPNNIYVISGDERGRMYMWHATTEEIVARFDGIGRGRDVYDIAISPSAEYVAAAIYDAKVLLWRIPQRALRAR